MAYPVTFSQKRCHGVHLYLGF
jgi:hypothetical protein